MTRGVTRGTVSKRDILRAWVSSRGAVPFELSEAKAKYDSISRVDPKFTVTEVRKIVSETHDQLPDGRWAMRGMPFTQELPRPTTLRDVDSWDHPVLLTAIDTLNDVLGAKPWSPEHIEVDFRNPGWMRIYNSAQAELGPGDEAGPLDCAIHVLAKIINGPAS